MVLSEGKVYKQLTSITGVWCQNSTKSCSCKYLSLQSNNLQLQMFVWSCKHAFCNDNFIFAAEKKREAVLKQQNQLCSDKSNCCFCDYKYLQLQKNRVEDMIPYLTFAPENLLWAVQLQKWEAVLSLQSGFCLLQICRQCWHQQKKSCCCKVHVLQQTTNSILLIHDYVCWMELGVGKCAN